VTNRIPTNGHIFISKAFIMLSIKDVGDGSRFRLVVVAVYSVFRLSCRNRKKTGTGPDLNRSQPDLRLRSKVILVVSVTGCLVWGNGAQPARTGSNRSFSTPPVLAIHHRELCFLSTIQYVLTQISLFTGVAASHSVT
jgi:hypothetical protein